MSKVKTDHLAEHTSGAGVTVDNLLILAAGLQSATGDKISTFYDVKIDYGAVGDGVTDDTTAFQNALNAVSTNKGRLYVPKGTYVVQPLNVGSNTSITMAPGAVLKAKTGYTASQRLLNIVSVSNVDIQGNFGMVQMLKAEYLTGEQRHGVYIASATNVVIRELQSIDSGGDGFYVGSNTVGVYSQNVMLIGCISDNNRRQGLSVTACKDFWAFGGVYRNTTGTAPAAGVDIEPNDAADLIQNVNLIGVRTEGNFGSGFNVVPRYAGSAAGTYFSVFMDGCASYNDATGNGLEASFRFDNGGVPANQIYGLVHVKNCRSYRSNNAGVVIGYYNWQNCPELVIDGMRITDPGTTAPPSTFAAAGVSMYTGFSLGHINKVTLKDVYCEDNRATKKMYTPFMIGGPLSGGVQYYVQNSKMVNCYGTGYLLADGPISTFGPVTNFCASHDQPPLQTFGAGNFSLQRYSGLLVTQSASGVLSLPSAVTYDGMEWLFENTVSSTLQVRPATGEEILLYGLGHTGTSGDLVSRDKGDYLVLKAVGGAWLVKHLAGNWTPLNAPARLRPIILNMAPSADRGDASVTVVPAVDYVVQRFSTALTANRTVTLSSTNAKAGDEFIVVRTGGGAFTLDVGGLKTIPASTSAVVRVMYTGSVWFLVSYSILNGQSLAELTNLTLSGNLGVGGSLSGNGSTTGLWLGPPSFTTGWSQPDTTNYPVRYWKDPDGVVHWRGKLTKTLAAATYDLAINLPTGYGIAAGVFHWMSVWDTANNIAAGAQGNGNVNQIAFQSAGANPIIDLSGIQYVASA